MEFGGRANKMTEEELCNRIREICCALKERSDKCTEKQLIQELDALCNCMSQRHSSIIRTNPGNWICALQKKSRFLSLLFYSDRSEPSPWPLPKARRKPRFLYSGWPENDMRIATVIWPAQPVRPAEIRAAMEGKAIERNTALSIDGIFCPLDYLRIFPWFFSFIFHNGS